MTTVALYNEYVTKLGTRFYNRLRELRTLSRLVETLRTIIIYGPRNAGKSELMRFFSAVYAWRKWGRIAVAHIDAREKRAESLGFKSGASRLASLIEDIVAGHTRLGTLVRLAEAVLSMISEAQAALVILYIDEFHLLFDNIDDAVRELEAVAGLLAKMGETKARLVTTVSEGFVATSDVRRRLAGYATGYMLVEPLDREDMSRVYAEYSRARGCRISLRDYWAVYGGAPGYLPETCHLEYREFIERASDLLRDTLDAALNTIAAEMGVARREVLGKTARLIEWLYTGGPPPRLEPREKILAEKLVEYNVVYPCRLRMGEVRVEIYIPQLPLFAATILAAHEIGVDEVSSLPLSTLRDWLYRRDWQRRCIDLETRGDH